jgi:3',5'-cyclic-nucleotide phosphodiesterase
LILVEIPTDEQIAEENRPPSPNEIRYDYSEVEGESLYGLRLLQWIASETQYRNLSRLFIPIAVLSTNKPHLSSSTSGSGYSVSGVLSLHSTETGRLDPASPANLDTGQILGYLDAGAADVVPSPFQKERIAGLAVHAYRAHKEVLKEQKAFLAVKRGRKRSWVGVDDERPYAYLREAMVSGLMDGICKPQTVVENFEFT